MKKNIDIVIPIYNEEGNINNLYKEICLQTEAIEKYEWYYIFVNDGSSDNSLNILNFLADKSSNVKIIALSRNFGKEIALTAGLDNTNADAVIFIDADLQHPPNIIPKLVEKWEKGCAIVTALRKNEKQSIIRKMGSWIFYWVLNKISTVKLTQRTTDFRLIDKKVIDVLKKFTERNRMFRGLIDWTGYKSEYIEFDASERKTGKNRYTYRKLISLAVNSITSFSLLPLRLAWYLGLFISSVSLILLIIMIIIRFILRNPIFSSLAFIAVGNTILIGIVLVCLGFMALYIGQIHSEVINRPLYVIKEKINFND